MKKRQLAVVAAIVLAVASFGVLDGAYFARNFVHAQLAEQKIAFAPYANDKSTYDAHPSLKKYAGKAVVNGWEARQYANVIGHHVDEATGGKSYSEISGAALANPSNQQLQAQRRTALDGQLLRGTLLNVYGWWLVGTIALWAGWIIAACAAFALLYALALYAMPAVSVRRANGQRGSVVTDLNAPNKSGAHA